MYSLEYNLDTASGEIIRKFFGDGGRTAYPLHSILSQDEKFLFLSPGTTSYSPDYNLDTWAGEIIRNFFGDGRRTA